VSKGQIVDTVHHLTATEVAYADLLLTGISQHDAYIQVKPISQRWKPATVDTAASLLASKVRQRNEAISKARSERTAMDIVAELETNVYLARKDKQHGAANGALQLLAKLKGLLDERAQVNLQVNTVQVGVTWDDRGVPVQADDGDEQA